MSSTSSARSVAHSGDLSEAKDFARSESRRESMAAVCRGAVADLGASIRNFASPRVAAMSAVRDGLKTVGKSLPRGERARFHARDGPVRVALKAPPILSRC
jgi:hypothetical protein